MGRRKKRKEKKLKLTRKERRKFRKRKEETTTSKMDVAQIETPAGNTTDFHQDGRGTVVIVGKKIFNLTPTNITIENYRKLPFTQIPHVRHLNFVPIRPPEEQKIKNEFEKEMHQHVLEIHAGTRTGITSVSKALREGVDPADEVATLLQEKAKAKKEGDRDKLKKIRQRLRKLDYKRYQEGGE